MTPTLAPPKPDLQAAPFDEPLGILIASDAAQGADGQEQKSPGAVENDASEGEKAWSNPSSAKSSDDSRATAALEFLEKSQYLVATNFGFALPEMQRRSVLWLNRRCRPAGLLTSLTTFSI